MKQTNHMCQPLDTTAILGPWRHLGSQERKAPPAFLSAESERTHFSLLPKRLCIPEYRADTVTDLGLTEPEETECAYQDHFLLILCEDLATPAMMGDDTRSRDEESVSRHVPSFAPRDGLVRRSHRDPRSTMFLDS